jgi:hypothetical protein
VAVLEKHILKEKQGSKKSFYDKVIPPHVYKSKCVNFFLWLRLILESKNAYENPMEIKEYKEEDQAIVSAIYKAFEELDNNIHQFARTGYPIGYPQLARPGACALISVNMNNKIYVANLGDSQGLLIREKKTKPQASSSAASTFKDQYNIYHFHPHASCNFPYNKINQKLKTTTPRKQTKN